VKQDEAAHVRFLINRARAGDEQQVGGEFGERTQFEPNPLLSSPIWVKEERALELFRSEGEVKVPEGVLSFLEEKPRP